MENYYKEVKAIELNITLLGRPFSTLADILQMDKDEAYNIFGIIEEDFFFLKSNNWFDLNLDLIREAIAFYNNKYGYETSGSIQNEIKKIWLRNLKLLDNALYLQTDQGQIDQFFERNETIKLQECAKKKLTEEKFSTFELVLKEISKDYVDRETIIRLSSKESLITIDELIEGILNWSKHWNKVHSCSYVLGAWRPLWYDVIKEEFTVYEKHLFFWLFLLEEERDNSVKFNKYFPKQYRTYSEENLKKLSDWLHSLNRVDLVAVDASKCHERPDDEEIIMSALNQGCGDVFGY